MRTWISDPRSSFNMAEVQISQLANPELHIGFNKLDVRL